MAERSKGLGDNPFFLGVLRVMAHVRDWTLSVIITMAVGFGIWAFWTSAMLPLPFWASFRFIARQWLGVFPPWLVIAVMIMLALVAVVGGVYVLDQILRMIARRVMGALLRDRAEVFFAWLNNPLSRSTRMGPFGLVMLTFIVLWVLWYFDFSPVTVLLATASMLLLCLVVYVVGAVKERRKLREVYARVADGSAWVERKAGLPVLKFNGVAEGDERLAFGLDP